MDFRLTDEQELLLEGLRELLARECSEQYIRECYERREAPKQLLKALMNAGYGMLGIPEKFGGTECDLLTLMLVQEEIARLTCAPIGLGGNAIKIDDMLTFGSEEQQKLVMDNLKEGGKGFSIGITEPQAGSDNSAIGSTATRKNGKVYINGHKTFITDVDKSPYMLCMTRNFESPKPPIQAMSMWLVPMDAPRGSRLLLWKNWDRQH